MANEERTNYSIFQQKWKDIPDYNGDYVVTDGGLVLSCKDPMNTIVLNKFKSIDGRNRVQLSRKGRGSERKFVDKLVARAFIGNVSSDDVVIHIDGDVTNDRVDNLRIEKIK